MAEKLTLPDPNVTLGKCTRCGAEIKMNDHWYTRFQQVLAALNSLLP